MERIVKIGLATAFGVNAVGRAFNLQSGLFDDKKWGRKLEFLASLHVLRLLLKNRVGMALIALLGVIRIRPKKGDQHPKLSIFQIIVRRLLFGRNGVALPPHVPFDLMPKVHMKYSPWERHMIENEFTKKLGSIYCIMRPFSSTDYSLAVPIVFISDPKLVREVMTDKTIYYSRGHTGFTSLVGDGLLGLPSGDKWHLHRQLVTKFLSEKFLRQFGTTIQGQTEILLEKWDKSIESNGGQVNGYYDLAMLTLDIIMRVGTGESDMVGISQHIPEEENEMAHDLDYALRNIVARTAVPLLDLLPNARIDRAQEMLNTTFAELVEDAKQNPKDNSMLQALLNASDGEGKPLLSDKDVSDEFKTVRGAGHETTSNTICFMLKLLSENPDKMAKAKAEVETKVAGRTATYAEAKDLKYLWQIMYETLRLYPTVPSFPRVTSEDTTLGGYDIPKGSFVFVSQYPLNHNPEIWENPEAFIPERFDELPSLQPSKPVGVPNGDEFGFLPFGAGPRTCVGQRLAMTEGVQILASILKNYSFRLNVAPNQQIDVLADVTMGPKHGLPLIVEKVE